MTQARLHTHNGKTQTLSQWAKELGVPRLTLSSRIGRGLTIREAAAIPINGAYGNSKHVPKITKNDLEMEIDETPIEKLPEVFRRCIVGFPGAKRGKFIRDKFRPLFDEYFEKKFKPRKLYDHAKSDVKPGNSNLPALHPCSCHPVLDSGDGGVHGAG